ncbi:hypothetical protein NY406_02245 [Chlorobaculum sp. MV4-Y]|jgi:hypothetical protein|uniref:hypothetical protein n=1 Tax=Chlorobaculum sp. MV4-Y TaxID=2976335 RepID=UPI0021B04283|nr:hypothetical protein [Chlorobaculum sp. MV4-Y]UWX58115.1 hypothetical protein NY406_02245 [Chlorobaculum sp. MV4-Y]
MRPVHIIRILPLCAALLFAGCGGNSTQQSGADSGNAAVQQKASKIIEPCQLITQDDAAKLLGEAVKPAEKSEKKVVGMKLCMYNPASGEPIPFLQVSLTQDAFFPPGGAGAAAIYKSLKDNFEGMRTDIDGVGDEAFIASGGIYIMADGYYIQIGAGNTSNATIRARLVEAGRMAVAKLKTLE